MIVRFAEGFASRLRVIFYRAIGVKILGHVSLRAIEIRRGPGCITLEDGAALDRGVVLLATSDAARIVIGPRTYINRSTMIDADLLVEIGAHVTILKGVTIGDGAVIGAGSVVTKSVPPGVIAVGNPARVLKPVPA